MALVVLIVQQQLKDSTWAPHGADWDTWYQSVAAIGHSGIKYPPNRWPAYAFFGALFGLLPGPLHVNVQVASLSASAASVAGVFVICRRTLGLSGALAAAALTLTFPMVVKLSSWISAYPVWATAAIWAVVGMVEALHTAKRGWWVVSGAGVAMVLAVMAKGLAIGLILLGIVVVSTLLTGRKCLGNLKRVAIPIVVMMAVYVVFPSPLLTLNAQVDMQSTDLGPPPNARMPTARGPNERSPLAPPGSLTADDAPPISDTTLTAEQRVALFEDGYIFGRSMNPMHLYSLLQSVRQGGQTPDKRRRRVESINRIQRLFPTADRDLQGWMLAGGGAGLLGSLVFLLWRGRRGWARAGAPLFGWLGVMGIIAGVVPSILSLFSPRFLTPAFFVLPIFVVAPVALLTRWTRWLSWIPLLMVPLALSQATPWAGSPWLQGDHIESETGAVEIRVDEAVQVWYALEQEFPGESIYVMTAMNQGILVLQGRPGTMSGGDPRFMDRDDDPPTDAQYILTAKAPTSGRNRPQTGYQEPSTCAYCYGRPVVRELRWPQLEMKLYGPAVSQ